MPTKKDTSQPKEVKFSFKIPIYDAKIYFTFTEDIDKSLSILPIELQNGKCHGISAGSYPDYFIIVKDVTPDTLTHECGHIARQLMNDIGFKIVADNDEPLAYLEGYIAKTLNLGLKKAKLCAHIP